MNKQTKMLLGVGVLGVAAYLIWKSQQEKSNQTGHPVKRTFWRDTTIIKGGDTIRTKYIPKPNQQ